MKIQYISTSGTLFYVSSLFVGILVIYAFIKVMLCWKALH